MDICIICGVLTSVSLAMPTISIRIVSLFDQYSPAAFIRIFLSKSIDVFVHRVTVQPANVR